MASDVNITSSAVNVVARLDQSKSYHEITKQLKAISNTINSTKTFQVKLNMSTADIENLNKMLLVAEQKKISALQAQKVENERLLGIEKQKTQEAKTQKAVYEAQAAAYRLAAKEEQATQKELNNALSVQAFQTKTDKWLISHAHIKNYDEFERKIKDINQRLADGTITTRQANVEFGKLTTSVQRLGKNANTMGYQVSSAVKQFLGIASVAQAVYLLINALKTGIGYVSELDAVMVDLQIASGKSADEVGRMMASYHDLAKEIGATSIEVAKASDGWLRQGYSASEANELIRNSTMLAKLGQMEASEATDALTSAMKAYKLEVGEVESVVDKFAATDMSAAVSAGYLATAMAQTAVGANKMGIDFDTLTGYIATVGEVTQQSAESVGNFFKTLVARMGNIKAGNLYDPESAESLSDVETVLNGVNIKLRDSQDEFRNFKDVLKDVSDAWDGYSSVQQRAIAVAFAGTRQQERFMVLMENYDKAIELAGISAESAGTATEKYGAYLDSIGAKSAEFKSAMYDLADSFINSGLVKGVVEFGTAVAEVVTALIDLGGVVPTLVTAFGLIKGISTVSEIYNLSRAFLELGDEITDVKDKAEILHELFPKLSKKHIAATVAAVENSAANDALGKTYDALGARINGAWKSLTGFVVANGATIASFAVPIALIWGLVAAQKAQEKQTQETRDAYKEASEEVKDFSEKIKEHEDAVRELKEQQDVSYSADRATQIEEQEEIIAGLKQELEYLQKIKSIREEDSHENAVKSLDAYTMQSGGYSRSGITGADIIAEQEMLRLQVWADKIAALEAEMRADPEKGASDKLIKRLEEYRETYRKIVLEMESGVISFITTTMEGLAPDSDEYKLYADIIEKYEELIGKTSGFGEESLDSVVDNTTVRTFHDIAAAMSEVSTESDILAEAISKLKDNSFDEVFSEPEKLNSLIEKFPELEDEIRAYANGLMSAEQLQNEFNTALRQFRGGQFIQALNDIVSAAEDYGRESSNVIEAVEDLDKILPGLSATLLDENGALTSTAVAALSSADALYECIAANKGLAVASAQMDLSNAVKQLEAVKSSALDSSIAMQIAMDQYYQAKSAADKATEQYKSDLEDLLGRFSKSSSASSSSASSLPSAYEKAIKELDHLRAMDLISEAEYYRRLEALANQYLKGKSKYIDEYRSVQEQLWAYQKELYEQQRDAEIEAAERRADARKDALEKQYEAEKEALEKQKDLLEDEKDAYKDLIDYKKDLLDDASDERSHDQRIEELNQDIAQIEAELAAIAPDNSAKANARRIELHDELLAKQQELEDEQWDWSVDNQKDALDEEYDRYEKTIDAQIKLLEEQLDALEKSYDAQLDRIEDMLEANIAAINSSFDALINRAAEAAAQIEAIFASINISTSQGIADLQAGLVGGGYDIGNWGSNNDGVDGVMGKDTIKGLQSYLNDLQSGGAISFGSPLNVDGIIGSKTRKAIDAAIAAGYLDPSFDSLHTGGIVGQKSGRNDLDIIKELIPLDDNEVWAKLLKKELVLTENQQNAVRNAFESIAAIKAPMVDASKARTMAGSIVNNSSPVFTINNVFEGDVDSDALRRLESWGESFKKDIQNGVFKTMNQQNKFAGKIPIKSY